MVVRSVFTYGVEMWAKNEERILERTEMRRENGYENAEMDCREIFYKEKME